VLSVEILEGMATRARILLFYLGDHSETHWADIADDVPEMGKVPINLKPGAHEWHVVYTADGGS
jgi:hypothetical protein